MNNIKIFLWPISIFLMGLSTFAAAVEGNFFYGAADFGEGKMNSFCTGVPAGVSCKDKDSGYRLSAGYQVIAGQNKEGIGIEGSYVNTGKGTFSGPGVSATMKNSELQLAAMGTLNVSDSFIVVSKAGLAFWSLKTTSTPAASGLNPNGVDFIWGLGAQFDINKSLALRCMYDSHMIGNSVTGRGTMTSFTLGTLLRF